MVYGSESPCGYPEAWRAHTLLLCRELCEAASASRCEFCVLRTKKSLGESEIPFDTIRLIFWPLNPASYLVVPFQRIYFSIINMYTTYQYFGEEGWGQNVKIF